MKILLSFFLFVFLSFQSLYAQESSVGREDFWVAPTVELSMYTFEGLAFGGGATLGYGDGTAMGLKVIYFGDFDNVLRSIEINFLVRFYLPRLTGHSGLFLQFAIGPVIFTSGADTLSLPSPHGVFSASASLGWRFIFGRHFFLEPAVRAGFPFIAGIGLSAGVRF